MLPIRKCWGASSEFSAGQRMIKNETLTDVLNKIDTGVNER